MEAVKYICSGYLIGIVLILGRILYCHIDSKIMEKWENEKIRKGIR